MMHGGRRRAWSAAAFALLLGVLGVLVLPGLAAAQDDPADTSTTTAPTAPAAGGPRIVATLTAGDDSEPVEGVVMVVSLDGDEVGTGTSDEDGVAAVEVPGAGQYEVTLTVQNAVGATSTSPGAIAPAGDQNKDARRSGLGVRHRGIHSKIP